MQPLIPEKITTVKFYNNGIDIMSICGHAPFNMPGKKSDHNHDHGLKCTCWAGDKKIVGFRTKTCENWSILIRKDNESPTPQEIRNLIKFFTEKGFIASLLGKDKDTGEYYMINADEIPSLGYEPQILDNLEI